MARVNTVPYRSRWGGKNVTGLYQNHLKMFNEVPVDAHTMSLFVRFDVITDTERAVCRGAVFGYSALEHPDNPCMYGCNIALSAVIIASSNTTQGKASHSIVRQVTRSPSLKHVGYIVAIISDDPKKFVMELLVWFGENKKLFDLYEPVRQAHAADILERKRKDLQEAGAACV